MKLSVQSLRFDVDPARLHLPWIARITFRRSVTGSACYWHAHDEHEVIFLIDGAATYVFRGRKDVHLRGGQFLVIPRGLKHRMPDDIDAPSFRIGFNLSADEKTNPAPFRRREWREILGALLSARLSPRPFSSISKYHLLELAKIAAAASDRTMTPIEAARFRLACSQVLADCAASVTDGTRISGEGEHSINAAIAYIERHAEEPFDLKALISHIGYSRSRLFSLFREKTGLSPAAYHQRQRLAVAQRLLDQTDLTSEEIGERLGFESPAYFTYAFRRCCGLTPIAFRNRKR